MKEFDEIESLFSSAFDGAEMTPPPSVKEAVDVSLFNNPKGGGFFWGHFPVECPNYTTCDDKTSTTHFLVPFFPLI